MPFNVINFGKEYEFEWKVENFSFSEGFYASPKFKFEREYWRLEVLFYGTGGYINLCLKRSSSGYPIEVEFTVAIKKSDGTKIFERRERKCFEEWDFYTINQWITKSEFINQQTEFLPSGCLHILFTMKRADSEESKTASAAAACSCCKGSIYGDKISFHKDFLNKETKCPRCDEVVSLYNYFDHICQMANIPAATSTSVSSAICDHEKILQDLKQLLLSQEQTDVILRVKGKDFPAHKTILVARSPVFASTFRHEMKENKTGIVNIDDCDPLVFPDFLLFLYSNDTDNLSSANVFGLFTIADKYDCQDLRAKCVHFIKDNLTIETFCKALALTLLHSEAELIHVATDCFIENADKILLTVVWQAFAAENITYCNELFIKYVNSTKRSNSYVSAINRNEKIY